MSMLKNVAKMYCKKNPIKVATTIGAAVVAGPVLGAGLALTAVAGVSGFILGKKIEDSRAKK